MEAPLADISQLTATAAGGTSHRDAQLGDTITKLRATRFPLMGVAGRVAPRLVISGGFTTYLDRSWDVTLRDSTVLRGELERYRDEITSDGSVGDIRLAAASRLSRRLAIGAGIQDRKSTRLNSSHTVISYAVFCLKKKKKKMQNLLCERK